MLQLIQEMDASTLLWIQEALRVPALNLFFRIFTTIGNAGLLWICISGVMLCLPHWRRIGVLSLAAMLLCYCGNDLLLKPLVMRVRPPYVVEGLAALVPILASSSFASGHTVCAFAAVNIYRRNVKKMWMVVLLFFAAALMGFSRLYVGVHYPTDVLCGAVIGLIGSALVYRGVGRLLRIYKVRSRAWQQGETGMQG